MMECSIQTSDSVKVADVAWASDAFIEYHGYETPYLRAPEDTGSISFYSYEGQTPKRLEVQG